jgi:hypothetical protein
MLKASSFTYVPTSRLYLAYFSDLAKIDKGFLTSAKKNFTSGILILLPDGRKTLFDLLKVESEGSEPIYWEFESIYRNKRYHMRIYNA